jgi:hypothetical protein
MAVDTLTPEGCFLNAVVPWAEGHLRLNNWHQAILLGNLQPEKKRQVGRQRTREGTGSAGVASNSAAAVKP